MESSRSAEGNVVDTDFSEALPMTALAGVVLSALLLEDDDFVAAAVPDDFSGDLRAAQGGDAGLDVLPVVTEKNLVEFELGASVADERRDFVGATRLDTELLAAGLDDSVHGGLRCGTVS